MKVDDTKPGSKRSPTGGEAATAKSRDLEEQSTGRVTFDDRGNAIWEWAITSGAYGKDVSTARLQKLDNPTLSLADDAPTPVETVRANPLGTKKGYNPYDSGELSKAAGPQRKKDLRKLSEWLKLKKQAENNKDDEEE